MGNSQSVEPSDESEAIKADHVQNSQAFTEVDSNEGETRDETADTLMAIQPRDYPNQLKRPLRIMEPAKVAAPAVSNFTASAEIAVHSIGMPSFDTSSVSSTNPTEPFRPTHLQAQGSAKVERNVSEAYELDRPPFSTALGSLRNINAVHTSVNNLERLAKNKDVRSNGPSKSGDLGVYKNFWAPEHQTYPKGILKELVPANHPEQLLSPQADSGLSRASDRTQGLERWTEQLAVGSTSETEISRARSLVQEPRQKARALHHQLFRDYSGDSILNKVTQSIINNPETSPATIQKTIAMLETAKKSVDRADEIVRKMGLLPIFCPSCRRWNDRDWKSWKKILFKSPAIML
ncbi:hypothetical protein EV356DRAFT_500410 [Viridothelium virens]|uniref:Uncharacterized protein n=1 Tax=Viridothelium virens TaxID=1048519 RepID=A0A6A6HCC8_VIRVR|nr:hypothetical protein EV356DRAFT_500410 [Viridothelium virens]